MAITLMDMLGQMAGGQVQQAGDPYGLSPQQSQQAVGALLPAISSAMKRNAGSPQGLAGLLGALQNGNHERYLDDPQALRQNAQTDGNAILGHLFGSKDVSRQVAARASQQTGIGTDVLKKMLPMVAMMAMGGMARRGRGGGGGGLGNLLGGLAMNQLAGGGVQGAPAQGLGGLLGGLMGGGAQATQAHNTGLGMFGKMLDADGDGNMFDDLLGMAVNRR